MDFDIAPTPAPAPFVKPVIDEGRAQQLDPKIKRVWQYGSLIGWGITLLIAGPFELLILRKGADWNIYFPIFTPIVCISFALLGWWIADKQYRAWTYALTSHELVLSHGVVWRSRRCVARGKVQHIDINSGPLDRRFGLVNVSIYVAGALGSVGSIPGLTPGRAEELRTAILVGRDDHA